ncbi:MAG TPA: DUF3999 family protein [bacterium]|nr:DUF3999 family protein [bacterium]
MKIFSLSLIGVFALVSASAMADGALKPNDFAYGVVLDTDGQSSVYEAPLPKDVYKDLLRNDRGDLRVFNAEGNVVPHVLAAGGATEEEMTAQQGLSVFPVREGVNQSPDALSVMIRQGGTDSEVNLKTQGDGEQKKKIVAYLLPASEVSGEMRSLTVNWSGMDETFLLPVTLEASDDLKTWRMIDGDGLIAQLSPKEGGGMTLKNRLDFSPTKAAYLRLKLEDAERIAPNLSLDSASVSYVTGKKAAEREWTTVKGFSNSPKVTSFDLGAPLPVDRLEIVLPEGNRAINAEISSNNRPEDAKTWQFSGLIYRLKQSGREVSTGVLTPSSAYERTPQRYWYLEAKDDSAGFGDAAPQMRAGWVPEKVVFVAEGNGPYTLAYGSATARKARFDENALLKLQEGAGFPRGAAIAGKAESLGGPGRLTAPPPPPPSMKEVWGKRAALAGMVLATALLGWMAYRVSRQMAG